MADEHPLREGLVRRQMLALYRAGRQADALRAFARTRALLADELGLDPSPALQALQLAILDHDPSLARPGGGRTGGDHRPERPPRPPLAGRRDASAGAAVG